MIDRVEIERVQSEADADILRRRRGRQRDRGGQQQMSKPSRQDPSLRRCAGLRAAGTADPAIRRRRVRAACGPINADDSKSFAAAHALDGSVSKLMKEPSIRRSVRLEPARDAGRTSSPGRLRGHLIDPAPAA